MEQSGKRLDFFIHNSLGGIRDSLPIIHIDILVYYANS